MKTSKTIVGIVVIAQTIVQINLGILLPPAQMAGMVGSFIVMSLVSTWLLVLLLRSIYEQLKEE